MAIKLENSHGSLWSRHVWLDGLALMQPATAWSACNERQATQQDSHNPQGRDPGRITRDASDRQNIKEALQNCIDTLATDAHPPGLLNVVAGLHAIDKVNTDEYIKIGREQMNNLNLGGQQASIRHWTRMWHWWLQPRRASSLTESPYMIPNLSTLESYVSNSIDILLSLYPLLQNVHSACVIISWE